MESTNLVEESGRLSQTIIDLPSVQKDFFDELRGQGKSANTLKNYRTDLECFNKYLREKQGSLMLDNFNMTKTTEVF
jgi:site-specific recombinase XerD